MPTPERSFPRTDAQHYGIVALMENTRIRLPLKAVECRFQIMDDIISVEIDQAFHNNQAKALDCLYSFPLPGDAAAYRCEMVLGDRVIRARVEERKEAKRIAQEKKAEGHRVALVEVERDNLFTLSLSNMQPQEIVVVRFAYFQPMDRLNDELSCMIPFCPGIRYIPGRPLLRGARGQGTVHDTDQVPDASRITPPRMDQFHPDATSLHIHGTFSHPLAQYDFVTSPSHTLVLKEEAGKLHVTVPQGGGSFPDRDFVLRWKDAPVSARTFEAWAQQVHHETDTPGTTYAMVRLQAPAAPETTAAPAAGQDFYFLVDRSGSMDGTKWTQASRAFREFLKVLGQNDRAWVTFFESTYQDLCEWPLDPKELLADRTVQQLETLGTLGGTELLPALDHVLEAIDEHSSDRRSVIILITDGQVGNETEVLRRLKKRKGALPVIALGIDTAVNEAFLQQLARQQRGQCFLRTPDDDIVGLVAQLGDRLKAPVLTDITAGEGWEFPADQPRDLYAREIVTAVLRGPGGARQLTITGMAADGSQQSYVFDLQDSPSEAVSLLWGRRRIQQLQSRLIGANTADKAALSAEMLTLAKNLNILCEGAAFLAVDESHKGEIAQAEVYQPSFQPQQPGAVFAGGAGAYQSMMPCPPPVPVCAAPMSMPSPARSARKMAAPPTSSMPKPGFIPTAISAAAGALQAGLKAMMPSSPPSLIGGEAAKMARSGNRPAFTPPSGIAPGGPLPPTATAVAAAAGAAGPADADDETVTRASVEPEPMEAKECIAQSDFQICREESASVDEQSAFHHTWKSAKAKLDVAGFGLSLMMQNRLRDWAVDIAQRQLLPTPDSLVTLGEWLLADSKLIQKRWTLLNQLTQKLKAERNAEARKVILAEFFSTEVMPGAGEPAIQAALK